MKRRRYSSVGKAFAMKRTEAHIESRIGSDMVGIKLAAHEIFKTKHLYAQQYNEVLREIVVIIDRPPYTIVNAYGYQVSCAVPVADLLISAKNRIEFKNKLENLKNTTFHLSFKSENFES